MSQPRQRKPAEDRRADIVASAATLFATTPWETVTISDVLAAAGLSKGGFYHHFRSKEDLLVAVVGHLVGEGLAAATQAPEDVSGGPAARLAAFLTASAGWQLRRAASLEIVADLAERPHTDAVFQRLFRETLLAAVPRVRDLVEAGVTDGAFDIADPQITAEMLLALSRARQKVFFDALAAFRSGDPARGMELISRRMTGEAAICERLVGMAPGSLDLAGPVLDVAGELALGWATGSTGVIRRR